MTFGEQIKSYRKENRITQNDLAKRLKITRQYLSHLENGKATPSKHLEKKIIILINKSNKNNKIKVTGISSRENVKSIYKSKNSRRCFLKGGLFFKAKYKKNY